MRERCFVRIRVASDVGGTFTDSVAYDETRGALTVAKIPTTPDNRAVGYGLTLMGCPPSKK